jgi:hypothetical protein
MRSNRFLALVALVLFVLSVWVYRASVHRAERFERGQSFLAQLNPDEIGSIELTKGEDTVVLKRAEDHFEVASENGYPAKNESVNRLIKNVLDISLEKQVGTAEALYEELELTPGGENTTEVVFKNAADKPMVHFLVGANLEGGSGSYVRRLDGTDAAVYLTSQQVYLNTGAKSFLKKDILDVKADQVRSIKGADFVVEEVDGELKLRGVPAGWQEKVSAMNRIKGVLSYLNFDEVYLGDDEAVRDLSFRQALDVGLKDDSGYRLALAEKGDETFLQIAGYHAVERLQVDRDESEEELQEKAEIMSRANEISEFNTFHGSWVYKISSATADKIKLAKGDLMEEKS